MNTKSKSENVIDFRKCSKCRNTGMIRKCMTCHDKSNFILNKNRIKKIKKESI